MIIIKDGLEPGVPNPGLVFLPFQPRSALPAWLQHPLELQPAGSCDPPAQRQLWCVPGASRTLLSLPSKQHLAGPEQPLGRLWCAAHLLFTAKSSLPCHSPQQTQGSCSCHSTLSVSLPRRATGVAPAQGGCWGEPAQLSALLDTVLLLSQARTAWRRWIQLPFLCWAVRGKGRLPLPPDPTQMLLHKHADSCQR